jgi:hypothetical protein
MKIIIPVISFLFILAIPGCQKSLEAIEVNNSPSQAVSLPSDNNILVDASKDGGGWWFPQAPGSFSESDGHQGKPLADYLRSLGYHVDELPRGAVITNELLANYSRIVRAAAFFEYTDKELDAYKNFMNKPGAILLFQDHLSYTTNDKLSVFLGLDFEGAIGGVISNFTNSEITNDITPLPFIAGSVVMNTQNNPNITVLGSLDKTGYTVFNTGDPFNGQAPDTNPPVMGIVTNFSNTKIFFIGDINGMEGLPQPLTQNLVNWLFK